MTAILSNCRRYRYTLERNIPGGNGQAVLFVMLNPSTADANDDDPTIRRCMGFVHGWGYSRLLVGNLSAYRATSPAEVYRQSVGPECDAHLMEMARRAEIYVCAWGSNAARLPQRAYAVLEALRSIHPQRIMHMGLTKGGHPKHPLYLRTNTLLVRWTNES